MFREMDFCDAGWKLRESESDDYLCFNSRFGVVGEDIQLVGARAVLMMLKGRLREGMGMRNIEEERDPCPVLARYRMGCVQNSGGLWGKSAWFLGAAELIR
jgi:hypothetical protein